MRVGVIGINHKIADVKLRELLAKACLYLFGTKRRSSSDQSFILLSTCNRIEIYFSSSNLSDTHSYILNVLRPCVQGDEDLFDQKLYTYFGYDCFLHLARVTAGLDSAIVAETEIQGQVKSAYEDSIRRSRLPSELHYLFQKSLKIGKQVRTELPMGHGVPDLEHAVLNAGTELFENRKETQILFVGASDINCKILTFLQSKGWSDLTICNRSPERAEAIAQSHHIQTLPWTEFQKWHQYDWVIFGTKAPIHLAEQHHLPTSPLEPKLIIDLCVPRNVQPEIGNHPSMTLLNIDQIDKMLKNRKEQMNHLLMQAELLVTEATEQQVEIFHQKRSRLHLLEASA